MNSIGKIELFQVLRYGRAEFREEFIFPVKLPLYWLIFRDLKGPVGKLTIFNTNQTFLAR